MSASPIHDSIKQCVRAILRGYDAESIDAFLLELMSDGARRSCRPDRAAKIEAATRAIVRAWDSAQSAPVPLQPWDELVADLRTALASRSAPAPQAEEPKPSKDEREVVTVGYRVRWRGTWGDGDYLHNVATPMDSVVWRKSKRDAALFPARTDVEAVLRRVWPTDTPARRCCRIVRVVRRVNGGAP